MTLQEVAKKFPKWSLIVKKEPDKLRKIGIIIKYIERHKVLLHILWEDDEDTFEYPEEIKPYGEIEAIKTLIDFAGRLLQGEATLCCGEEDKLKEAIATCEGAFGI